jgi:probable FeS assembly SUF system protein SufT
MREEVTFSRSAEAIMIPSGEKVLVPKGAQATITQDLGGTYTIITDRGLMVRISGREVEAIGKTPQETAGVKPEDLTPQKLEEMVWDTLKTCYDPEIPVNIVDLGLVYLCEVVDNGQGGETAAGEGGPNGGSAGKKVHIKMTLTAPGCGMGPVLASDVKMKLETLPGIKTADVEVVFDPVWDRSMMSEAARLQLGMMW